MSYMESYEKWLTADILSTAEKDELKAVANDAKELEDRFYRGLEFGTAGMRGVLGMGTNRINIYNVRQASYGVAAYVKKEGAEAMKKGVLISYDTRIMSREFAEETAKVLAKEGIKVYLFDTVHSVPECSFGIRELGCAAGVMVTASHNPKEYNGYKVYGPDGGQLPPDAVQTVIDAMDSIDIFAVEYADLDDAIKSGAVEIVGPELNEKFLQVVQTQQCNPEAVKAVADTFKLIYTPFHGTGSRPVKEILKRIGFKNVLVVKEQDTPDGNFPTVKSPNPENKEGFNLAIKMAKENDVDVIFGTDPDCDRVGIVVRDAEGEYRTLTGNQTGALLVDYILRSKTEQGTLPSNGIVIKTIVTTELAAAIAKSYGAECMSVLTGFKYIGEKMTDFGIKKNYTYLIGFEESYGYLVGNHARDKDGVVASMLIAEMAAYYKTKGKSLYEALQDIYAKHGTYVEKTMSYTMPGKDGMEKMAGILAGLRENPPASVNGMKVVKTTDYKESTVILPDNTELPKANVLRYDLDDGKTYFIVRPSGTEPKIKLYLGTNADTVDEANELIEAIVADCEKQFNLV
ncbi:MAG: phospho-sugar mutase [Clostridiales bacterium]|nr:phospho-sugar mutase [Clostridiales bacterium]